MMDTQPVTTLANSEIAKVEAKLLSLSQEIEKLRQLKKAWETIRDAELETPGFVSELIKHVPARPASAVEERLETTAAYGDKTNGLRRYVAQNSLDGLTRYQIVEESKRLGGHPNFPYRFIARMTEAGELIVENDRYYATTKMKDKLREVAAA